MNGGVEFNGLFAVLIFFATVIFLIVISLINLTFYLSLRNSNKNKSSWTNYFLLSAIILLVFDGIFYLLIFVQGNKTFTRNEAIDFDNRMLTIWIPFHIIGYFIITIVIRYFMINKEKMNKFIDKFR